jgi:hypothetical protein
MPRVPALRHVDALTANYSLYAEQLNLMIDRKVALHFSSATKSRYAPPPLSTSASSRCLTSQTFGWLRSIMAACLCVEAKQTPQNHSKIDYAALRKAASMPLAPGGMAVASASGAVAPEKKEKKSRNKSKAQKAENSKEADAKSPSKESDSKKAVESKAAASASAVITPAASASAASSGEAKDSKDAKDAKDVKDVKGEVKQRFGSLTDLLFARDDLIG